MKKYEPLLGSNSSNLLQAMIFSPSHSVAGIGTAAYTPFTALLVLITFLLGFIWVYVMQRMVVYWVPFCFMQGLTYLSS